ncbi:hypothetical protein HDU77_006300 [Chytriomyces hyalinus]|nr:hypothetical protein HDU77_006300 [Chytriomyces hyalinus]
MMYTTKTCFIPSSTAAATTARPTTPLKRLLLSDAERHRGSAAVKTTNLSSQQPSSSFKVFRQNASSSSSRNKRQHLKQMQSYYNSYILESNSFKLDEMTVEELEQVARKRHSAHKDRLERLYRDAMDLWTRSKIVGGGGGGRDDARACSSNKRLEAAAAYQGSQLDHLLVEYPLNSFATLALWHGDRDKGRLVEDSDDSRLFGEKEQ